MADTSPDRSCISLPLEAMQRFGYRIVDLLAEHFAQMEHGPVDAKADPAQIIPLFDREPSEHGRDPQEILAQLERDVFPNNLHVDHPRFFAFVPGPNNFVSAMADALAAGFNVFNGTWFGGSAAAALELGLVRWLCRVCGLPADAGGLFVSGGLDSGLVAAIARRAKENLECFSIGFEEASFDESRYAQQIARYSFGIAIVEIALEYSRDLFRFRRGARNTIQTALSPAAWFS